MCLGLFALQDNIPSLLKDEPRAVLFLSSLPALSPFASFMASSRLASIFLYADTPIAASYRFWADKVRFRRSVVRSQFMGIGEVIDILLRKRT